jgi:hypothetical protein
MKRGFSEVDKRFFHIMSNIPSRFLGTLPTLLFLISLDMHNTKEKLDDFLP